MKRIVSILLPLAVLAVTSCQKELVVSEETNGSFYLEARISDEAVTPGTKTYLAVGYEQDRGVVANVNFVAGDLLAVKGTGDRVIGKCMPDITNPRNSTFAFTLTSEPAGDTFEYMLPADMMKDDGTLTIPETITYVPGNPFSGVCPLYAKGAWGTTTLDAVTAFLQIPLKGDYSVKSVVVEADKQLSGDFYVENKTAIFKGESNRNKITLDCGNGGVALNGRKTYFYVPILAGTYKSLKVTVNKVGDSPISKTAGQEASIERLNIYCLPMEPGVVTDDNIAIKFEAQAVTSSAVLVKGTFSEDYVLKDIEIKYQNKYQTGTDSTTVECFAAEGSFEKLITVLSADKTQKISFTANYYKKDKARPETLPETSGSVTFTTLSKANTPAGAVDLGLSVDWANANVSTTTSGSGPTFGDYYAWGETETHYDSYDFAAQSFNLIEGGKYHYNYYNYKWFIGCKSSDIPDYIIPNLFYYDKYFSYTNSRGDVPSVPDISGCKLDLDIEDDVAAAQGGWRMPSKEEFEELIAHTTQTLVWYKEDQWENVPLETAYDLLSTNQYVRGVKFTSIINGKDIIFPISSSVSSKVGNEGIEVCAFENKCDKWTFDAPCYWSRTMNVSGYPFCMVLHFNPNPNIGTSCNVPSSGYNTPRYHGAFVRAVYVGQ